jgi:hypothetical protein
MDADIDAVGQRLRQLAETLSEELGDSVSVSWDSAGPYIETTRFAPTNSKALPISWVDFGDQLDVWAGHNGGWWEDVGRDLSALDFVEDLTRSVMAGRVSETYGFRRSRVEVTLADGTSASETGSAGLRGCLPQPLWRRRGRRIQYEPYRS